MPSTLDRLTLLRQSSANFTGIDFIHVLDAVTQTTLRVYFHTNLAALTDPFSFDSGDANALLPAHITIRNVTDPTEPKILVVGISGPSGSTSPGFDDELKRSFFDVEVDRPGDFAEYKLRINDPIAGGDESSAPFSRIDPYFNDVSFSFKAACPSDQECLVAEPECPEDPVVDFPVDYLARDFESLKNALLDFSAQRYPNHSLPVEADVAVMLAEVMAALGDEFAYIQDRYAREAYLETATQRRSLRKKARLLDFEIHDGMSPRTNLEFVVNVDPGEDEVIPAGSRAWAVSESAGPIPFEVGEGLRDEKDYPVRQAWNARDTDPTSVLVPYCFDASDACLPVGSTSILLEGEFDPGDAEALRTADPPRLLLFRIDSADPSVPSRRHFARVIDVVSRTDPLNLLSGSPRPLTELVLHPEDATPFQLDQDELNLSLNVLPATGGETRSVDFVCGPEPATPDELEIAVERQGPLFARESARPTVFLFGLQDTDTQNLGFLDQTPGAALRPSLRRTTPEVVVRERGVAGNEWTFVRSMLTARASDEVFTLEDGLYKRIISYHRDGEEIIHRDYASGNGYSLRFGDGMFGAIPARGQEFTVEYRFGPGAEGNVPEGAITHLTVPGGIANMPGIVTAVNNPEAVTSGEDPESAADIKLLTPEAFRADVLFAVRPEDYGTQAERLEFVQRAHGTPRYTGSWTTMFAAADPFGANSLTSEQREQLENLMNCVRQTGRDVVVKDPKTLTIDLIIKICVEPFAFAAEVGAQVQELLVGRGGGRNSTPFFSPDNFTFGTPLRRSALEALIESVPGVRFVEGMWVREHGVSTPRAFRELLLQVDPDQVIRLDNEPLHPESGSLTVMTNGGA